MLYRRRSLRPPALIAALLLAFVMALPRPSGAQEPVHKLPINPDNITQLFAYLDSCVPLVPGSEGSEMTLRFSLTHDGALRGPPMVTYSNLKGSTETQRLFATTVLDALRKCAPIPMTDEFGKIASSKMILWKVRSPPPNERSSRFQPI